MARKIRNDRERPESWGKHKGHLGLGRNGSPAPPHSLTFPYILLTLAHIHVDKLRPLHAEEDVRGRDSLDA